MVPDTEEEFTLGTGTEQPPQSLDSAGDPPPVERVSPRTDGETSALALPARAAPMLTPAATPPPDMIEEAPFVIGIGEPPRRGRRGREPQMADDDRGKMVAILWFVGVVTVGYAVLAAALAASPGLTEQWVGNLPWIGSLRDDRLLTRKVTLSEVDGMYQRIRDGKDVFVISGKAMNTAPVPLQGVQISGRLFDAAGMGLDEKVIHCGNVISTRVLKDLTPRELSVLQKLNPPSRFTIEPGASSTFVIVFMDPPKGAVSFSAQVVAAHRQV